MGRQQFSRQADRKDPDEERLGRYRKPRSKLQAIDASCLIDGIWLSPNRIPQRPLMALSGRSWVCPFLTLSCVRIHFGAYVIMAPSVSTGDGGRNVAGKYFFAEPLDYFHFAEAPDWVYGLVLRPDPETRPAASVREIDVALPSKRKGSGFELEVVKVLQGYASEAVKIPLRERWQASPTISARC